MARKKEIWNSVSGDADCNKKNCTIDDYNQCQLSKPPKLWMLECKCFETIQKASPFICQCLQSERQKNPRKQCAHELQPTKQFFVMSIGYATVVLTFGLMFETPENAIIILNDGCALRNFVSLETKTNRHLNGTMTTICSDVISFYRNWFLMGWLRVLNYIVCDSIHFVCFLFRQLFAFRKFKRWLEIECM